MKARLLFACATLSCCLADAQFKYEREVKPVQNALWQEIDLPNAVLAKLNADFGDVRLFSSGGQEVPYLLRIALDKLQQSNRSLAPFNVTKKGKDLYFTIKTTGNDATNRAAISLSPTNYDCNVMIEGSQDEKEWFTVVDNLRIVGIDDSNVKYESNVVTWPAISFPFLRFRISNAANLSLREVDFLWTNIQRGTFEQATVKPTVSQISKTTEFLFNMTQTTYLSKVKINVADGQKFYRSFVLEGAADSIKTEKGWVLNYRELYSGVMAFFRSDSLSFSPMRFKKLRLTVFNQDSAPIKIESITTFSPIVTIAAQLPTGTYTIRYGNENLNAPSYDLTHFANEIATVLPLATLGEERHLNSPNETSAVPWFKNKNWLWVAMLLIVALLGYFTFTIIRKA